MRVEAKKLRQVFLYRTNLIEAAQEAERKGNAKHHYACRGKAMTINTILKKLGLPLTEAELIRTFEEEE